MTDRKLIALMSVSALLHVGVFHLLGGVRERAPARRAPTQVTMTIATPPPAPPPPAAAEPPPPPQAAPRPKLAARMRPVAPAAPPPPSAAAPAPAPATEPVVDLTGVTLTNDGPGPGWSSLTGNGQAMGSPLGRVGKPAAAPAPPRPQLPAGPPLVALADLSRPPEAPDLDGVLEQHYPEAARREGRTGSAVVRLRVLPDGGVTRLDLIAASSPDFGDACQRTLRGSRWAPPLDAEGRPCATDLRYTCRFQLGR